MSLISNLVAFVKADVERLAIPQLIIFLNSVSSNPSSLNLAMQLAKLEGALLAAGPQVFQDTLKDLANVLQTELEALQPPPAPIPPPSQG